MGWHGIGIKMHSVCATGIPWRSKVGHDWYPKLAGKDRATFNLVSILFSEIWAVHTNKSSDFSNSVRQPLHVSRPTHAREIMEDQSQLTWRYIIIVVRESLTVASIFRPRDHPDSDYGGESVNVGRTSWCFCGLRIYKPGLNCTLVCVVNTYFMGVCLGSGRHSTSSLNHSLHSKVEIWVMDGN